MINNGSKKLAEHLIVAEFQKVNLFIFLETKRKFF